jgi:hypothetical protein
MAVVQKAPSTLSGIPSSPEPTNADLLFKEAKQRERRRRLAWLGGIVVVVGAAVAVVAVTSSQPKPSPHHPKVSSSNRPKPTNLPTGSIPSLNHAGPLAVDPAGRLYVSDESHHQVLVRLANGQFSAVAGDGQAGFSGDGGPATKASLSDVSDMSFAPNGDLYLADGGRVRVVDSAGTIRTIAGDGLSGGPVANGTPALSAPLGPGISIALSPTGQLYLATPSQLLRLSSANLLDSVPAVVSSGPPESPKGTLNGFGSIAVDGLGDVYASSTFTGWSVYKISPGGTATSLGYARRSGGNTAVVQRGADDVIEVDDGQNILRVEGDQLVTSLALNKIPGINTFVFTNYFALAPDGTVYADDLGPPAFEPYQQIVSVTNGRAVSLWKGAPSK